MQAEKRIQPIARLPDAVAPAAAHKTRHNAEDILIPYAGFLCDAVVSQDHVILRADFDDTVQHVPIGRAAVEHHVATLQGPVGFAEKDLVSLHSLFTSAAQSGRRV